MYNNRMPLSNTVLMPHQARAVRETYDAFREGKRAVVLQLPTGAGKTVVAARIIHDAAVARGRRCIFVTHRLVLAAQAHEKLAATGARVGLIAEGDSTDPSAPVQVVNMGTITSGAGSIPVLGADDLIVVDEAHRADARMLAAACPAPRRLLLTATPSGDDGSGLGMAGGADALVHGPSFRELERAGVLVPVRMFSRDIAVDAVGAEVNRAMSQSSVLAGCVEDLLARSRAKTVVFTSSIAHCDAVTEALLAAGARARAVHSSLSDRDDAMRAFEDGDDDFLVNAQVLCEGWDFPALRRVAIMRGVGSTALFLQMVGRVVRPWCYTCRSRPRAGCSTHAVKRYGELVDYGANWLIHGHPTMDRKWTLDGGARDQVKSVAAGGVWRCQSCFGCAEHPYRVCPYCGAKTPMRTIRLARGGMREYVEQDPAILAAGVAAADERKRRADLHRRVTGILIRAKRWPGGRAGAEAKRIISECRGDAGAVMKQVSFLTGGV